MTNLERIFADDVRLAQYAPRSREREAAIMRLDHNAEGKSFYLLGVAVHVSWWSGRASISYPVRGAWVFIQASTDIVTAEAVLPSDILPLWFDLDDPVGLTLCRWLRQSVP